MRAMGRTEYGDSNVLTAMDVDIPELTEGRVLVRVRAAGVNMAEWHLMSGRPMLVRLAMGLTPKDAVLGADVAGVVEAVGLGVTRFAVGDEVFGSAGGSWAEVARAREELLAPLPAGVTFEQAAGVPMAGYTALQALAVAGDLAGKRVVITGAGGGVGSYLVQLAAARGAHVTAVCSAAKAEFVRGLGADDVLDYRVTDVTAPSPAAGDRRFDAVFDFAGGLPIGAWKRVIVPRGLLVLGGDENGGAVLGPISRSLRGMFARGIRVVTLMATSTGTDLAELARLLASGELRSTVTATYPLADARRAVDDLSAGRVIGKAVLIP